MTEKIEILGLRKHPDYIRGQHSKTYSDELLTALNDSGKTWIFPPILVQPIPLEHDDRKDGGKYWILDGMHRFDAAVQGKLVTVPADVMSGLTREESIAIQIKTNMAHGLRLSVSAQTNAIMKLHELKMEGKKIAEKTGLHPSSISRILKGTQRAKEDDSAPTENGKVEKKKPIKFNYENWLKGLMRSLKAWEKYGTKIRKSGFPEPCGKAMDVLASKILYADGKE